MFREKFSLLKSEQNIINSGSFEDIFFQIIRIRGKLVPFANLQRTTAVMSTCFEKLSSVHYLIYYVVGCCRFRYCTLIVDLLLHEFFS